MKDFLNDKEFENCILCGVVTDIQVSMPVEYRKNYIIGLGQLCDRCAGGLARETAANNRRKRFSERDMTELLNKCRKK